MTYLSSVQRNVLLLALLIPFLITFYFGYSESWVFILYLAIYFLFVVVPVSKNIYYENGTWVQRTILTVFFIFLSCGVLLSYNYLDTGFLIIIIFSIIFLNYTSITLQISPNYHPIITNPNSISIILNIVIIISFVTSLFITINTWRFEYITVPLVNILFIGLIVSSFIYYGRYKESFNNYSDDLMNQELEK